jgi:hypothetical protein
MVSVLCLTLGSLSRMSQCSHPVSPQDYRGQQINRPSGWNCQLKSWPGPFLSSSRADAFVWATVMSARCLNSAFTDDYTDLKIMHYFDFWAIFVCQRTPSYWWFLYCLSLERRWVELLIDNSLLVSYLVFQGSCPRFLSFKTLDCLRSC